MILVSACLAGFRCRYDASIKPIPFAVELVRQGKAVPVCPEVLGGLTIPRVPAEIVGGSGTEVLSGSCAVVNEQGFHVTDAYIRGAILALNLGLEHGARAALLKARSPSCGCGQIYDGSFSHRLRTGDGVFTALLKKHNIPVFTEETFPGKRNGAEGGI